MFRSSRRISDLETRVAALALAVAEMRNTIDKTSNVELLKLVQSIQNDLDVTRSSLRSLHGKVAIAKRHEMEAGTSRAAADVTDDELQSFLDLQQNSRSN